MLVTPGGGYQRVVLDKEGDETALRLAQAGVTAGVLVYRLPEDGWAAGSQAPLQDAQRAMRMMRALPGIDTQRAGVLGFSAGGNLVAALAMLTVSRRRGRISSALIYAAYLDGTGSKALTLGPDGPAPDLIAKGWRATQPMFLLHAADDATVQVELSVRMYDGAEAAGGASELHVFPEGGHGFGIARAAGKPVAAWPELFLAWGQARGIFPA